MNKFSIIALVLVLTLSLCACGRRNNTPAMPDPTVTTPAPSTIPSKPVTDPTNIPDPEVNPNSTMPGGMTSDPDNDSMNGSEGHNGNTGVGQNGSTGESGTDQDNNATGESQNRMRRMK